jgi:hypothetical protein
MLTLRKTRALGAPQHIASVRRSRPRCRCGGSAQRSRAAPRAQHVRRSQRSPACRQWQAAKRERGSGRNGRVWVLARRPRSYTRWATCAWRLQHCARPRARLRRRLRVVKRGEKHNAPRTAVRARQRLSLTQWRRAASRTRSRALRRVVPRQFRRSMRSRHCSGKRHRRLARAPVATAAPSDRAAAPLLLQHTRLASQHRPCCPQPPAAHRERGSRRNGRFSGVAQRQRRCAGWSASLQRHAP